MSRNHDRVAIVTGSSRGIGLAICRRLVDVGINVVLNARHEDELHSAVAALREDGGTVVGVVANMKDEDTPGMLVRSAIENFGQIDFVVNNAGASSQSGSVLTATRDAFLLMITINAWAPLALIQEASAAGLGRQPGSAVVNISTIGSRQVQPLLASYTASKAALDVFTKVLARELGPRGVRVNTVAPGLVRTRLARAIWEGDRGPAESDLLPLQRLGEPDDIAAAVEFLLSEKARWITGVTVDVDGGRMLVGGEPRELIGLYPDL